LPIPAYDYVLKCSHAFNLLDARGVISVTDRTAHIASVRDLARKVAALYLEVTADGAGSDPAAGEHPGPSAGESRRAAEPGPGAGERAGASESTT